MDFAKMHVKWDGNRAKSSSKTEENIKRKIELVQIKKQIEVLLTFLPDQILRTPLNQLDQIQNFVGVLLFADVSGFTPLCEKYNKTGKGGIYRLTNTLNAYIGAIVEVIYFYGGDVLKFSGDAFLASWHAHPTVCLYEVIHQVIVCALFIQETLGRFETEVNVLLKVKLAISCGNMTFSIIGDDDYNKHYIIVGPAINDVKAAEHVSVSGDVVMSPGAWGHVAEESYEVTYAEGGNVKIWKCIYNPKEKAKRDMYNAKFTEIQSLCETHLDLRTKLHHRKRFDESMTDSKLIDRFVQALPPRATTQIAVQSWICSDLEPFIIKPVRNQIEERQPLEYLTEMREVTIQFINIVPTTFQESKIVILIKEAYKIICTIANEVLGVVNKVSLFDKDAMILVLFGLKGIKHELESQNALRSAYAIRRSISCLETVKSVSVGVTNGLVYCGVVGHPLRKEYTVIGGAVNKAARIMCAYEHKVTCDFETYKNSKLSSTYFQLQSAFKLKGIESAGHIFEYNEDFEEPIMSTNRSIPLVGRTHELDYVHNVLFHPHKANDYYGVLVKGNSKTGKTYIIESILRECIEAPNPIATCSLIPGAQKPYHAACNIYSQLYDFHSTFNPGSHESIGGNSLNRLLWDFNEILQLKVQSVPGSVKEHRKKLCESFIAMCRFGDIPFIFIDDIQHIDSRSMELLEAALKVKSIKLVCGGFFEVDSWKSIWKVSLVELIKVIDLDPIEDMYIPIIICQFLNVKGVPKKLCHLIAATCEGRPGWIQTCLLKLLNNNGILIHYVLPNKYFEDNFVFPIPEHLDNKYRHIERKPNIVIPVAFLTEMSSEKSEDLTLAAISLDLFDSFPPYQQLIIKTAAVLGDLFTRNLLIIVLKFPNMQLLTCALKHLFEEEVFDCGSRYISSGGVFSRKVACNCYMDVEDINKEKTFADFPRYAFCKILHFKNKTLRTVAYELLPANQKKELHLRITDILEYQNNCCPTCQVDYTASMIKTWKFRDMRYMISNRPVVKHESLGQLHFNVKTVIRDFIYLDSESQEKAEAGKEQLDVPLQRKEFNQTQCFCLEILTRVYGDLVHHSEQAGHTAKRIFFTYQYGLILLMMDEYEDAIDLLKEATELCFSADTNVFECKGIKFSTFMLALTTAAISEAYYQLGQYKCAKNYIILSLRQFGLPVFCMSNKVAFKMLTSPIYLKQATFPWSQYSSKVLLDHFLGKILNITTRILVAQGHWTMAERVLKRSMDLIANTNPSINVLCDVYCTALDLYQNMSHERHICEELNRCLGPKMLENFSKGLTEEYYFLAKLVATLLQMSVRNGKLVESLRIGYRSFYLNYNFQLVIFQMETIPTLSTNLLECKRICEAVQLITLCRNFSKYDSIFNVMYYSFCLVLMIKASFYVESVEVIEEFALKNYDSLQKSEYPEFINGICINLAIYYLREENLPKAATWYEKFDESFKTKHSLCFQRNKIRIITYKVILLFRDIQARKENVDIEIKKMWVNLNLLKKHFKSWVYFHPRMLLLEAYFLHITGKTGKARSLAKKAREVAIKQNNIQAECTADLALNTWKRAKSFDGVYKVQYIFWQLSRQYDTTQWTQIMYPLPC